MHNLLTVLQDLPPFLVYVVAALLVTAETAVVFGLFLPAEATLLMVGFLAYLGTLRLVPTIAVMILAAVTGDTLAYRSGRRHGPRIRASRIGGRIGEERWSRADSMLHRLGGRGIFAARWVAFARTLVPRLAGSAGMSYRRFAPWNVAGVATWVGASVLVGYLAGTSYERVSEVLGRATGAVLGLFGCVLAIVLAGRWLGRNPDPARALLTRAGQLPVLRWLRRRYGVLFFLLSMHIGAGWALLINLATGMALLFVGGLALVWLVRTVVEYSGLSAVDTAIARLMVENRASDVDSVALAVVSTVRGSFLIITVALVAVVLGWRYRAWRGDLVSLIGTAGAFLPLMVLTQAAERGLPAPGAGAEPGRLFLPTQNTIVTASLCTLAWLFARRARWPWAVTAWTSAAVGVVIVVGARIYLGWNLASEAVTSVLLGVLWTGVFMVAWASRDRAAARDGVSGGPRDEPSGAPGDHPAARDARSARVDPVDGATPSSGDGPAARSEPDATKPDATKPANGNGAADRLDRAGDEGASAWPSAAPQTGR